MKKNSVDAIDAAFVVRAAQLAEFNEELGRRLASLDCGATAEPAEARARLQRKSAERRKPRA